MMASTATVEVLLNLQLTVYIFPLFSPESFLRLILVYDQRSKVIICYT